MPFSLTMFQCFARKSLAAAKSSSAEISFLKYYSVVNFNSRNSPKRGKPIIVVDMLCPPKILIDTIISEDSHLV